MPATLVATRRCRCTTSLPSFCHAGFLIVLHAAVLPPSPSPAFAHSITVYFTRGSDFPSPIRSLHARHLQRASWLLPACLTLCGVRSYSPPPPLRVMLFCVSRFLSCCIVVFHGVTFYLFGGSGCLHSVLGDVLSDSRWDHSTFAAGVTSLLTTLMDG